MLSVPILVKLEFFQHPRGDVIEVCMYHFCDYHFSTIFRIKVLSNILFDASTFSGIFLVLNQSMSVKIIFIYSNENDGFNIKIIIFWSKKPQQIWRRKKLTSVCFRISKRFQQNSTLQKTTGGGKDYTDTKNDQRTLALQM